MKMKAVCEVTGLTDRTVRYYIEEQLITPAITENYYGRKQIDFSPEEIDALRNISVLRKFDFTIEEIRRILRDADASPAVIRAVKLRNSQALDSARFRQSILSQIDEGKAYSLAELARELCTASESLPKAEEAIKPSLGKNILAAIKTAASFLLVWLPVAMQVLFFIMTLAVYTYPKVYPIAQGYMLLSVMPSVLVLLLNKVKGSWKKYARGVLLVLCALSLLCAFFVGCLPPDIMAMSETDDITHYRKVDADCLASKDTFYMELFPAWPHYFVNQQQSDGSWETVYLDARYYYRYISLVDYTYDIYAQWPLEPEVFDREVARVQRLFDREKPGYQVIQKGDYTCLMAYEGDAPFETATNSYQYYIFAYDEANRVVRYILCVSLENGADQPFYLDLEWE